MNKSIAVFPGSFDPFTKGHEDIVLRALPLFDKIIIAVGSNSQKQYYFELQKRVQLIKSTFAKESKIVVETYDGLTVNFCKKAKAAYILRGLRNTTDFEFEKNIAQMNLALEPTIETFFIMCTPALSAISSTIVRDIIKNGGDVHSFIPKHANL